MMNITEDLISKLTFELHGTYEIEYDFKYPAVINDKEEQERIINYNKFIKRKS